MSLILNIETSEHVCSVAISKDKKLVAIKEDSEGMSHSKLLARFVDDILKENDIKPNELDAIAVSKGPGSYTGLRIGVSFAKGMCYGLDIPLISVGTLEALANAAIKKHKTNLICPMIDARRMEVYTALYNGSLDVLEEVSAEIVDVDFKHELLQKEKIVFCGSGSKKFEVINNNDNSVFDFDIQPSTQNMIEISYKKFKNKEFEDNAYFEPFYLKDFIAIKPKNKMF
jgi:tRNA threonylcarbamoyladenosine biosynthesis protein TsaB